MPFLTLIISGINKFERERDEFKTGWPSGLRRWIKAPISSGAWVRIPLQSNCFVIIPPVSSNFMCLVRDIKACFRREHRAPTVFSNPSLTEICSTKS